MLAFATEFPVISLGNRADFVAEVVVWLKGMTSSTVLAAGANRDLDGENALIRSGIGEELRLRELRQGNSWSAIGFRHDFPDGLGRLWRTEGVSRKGATDDNQDLIRFRTQCIPKTPVAVLEAPLKPYFIKSLLKKGSVRNSY